MKKFYVAQLLKDFDYPVNMKTYKRGRRFIVWEFNDNYVISGSNMEYLDKNVCKVIYKVKFEKVEE